MFCYYLDSIFFGFALCAVFNDFYADTIGKSVFWVLIMLPCYATEVSLHFIRLIHQTEDCAVRILVGEIISSELFSSRKKARLWFNPCRGDFRTRPLTFYEVLNFVWHLASSMVEGKMLHRKYAESFNFVKRRLSHRLRSYSLGNIFLSYQNFSSTYFTEVFRFRGKFREVAVSKTSHAQCLFTCWQRRRPLRQVLSVTDVAVVPKTSVLKL